MGCAPAHPTPPTAAWGNPIERERLRRINVAAWAYAYEIDADPLVDDAMFDRECLLVNTLVDTGNKKLDAFFRKHFSPDTGMWVHKHPDIEGLRRVVSLKREGARMFKDNKFGLGEQKLLAQKIMADLNDHTAEKYDDGHRGHLGASQIGHSCPRKLWYGFRWCFTATYINAKGENHKGRMMRLFNRGHNAEDRFIEWLEGMGFKCLPLDPATGKQFRITDVNGHYGGSLDGMVTLPERYGPLPKMLLEFKTSSEKYFDKLKDEGVKLAKPDHYAQMSSYGKRYDLKYALYMCINKNTDEVYIEIVELDWNLADQLTQKAHNIINSPVPPPKLSENSAYYECKFCDFAPICHGQAAYEKNCRSCANAMPAENGEWRCAHFGVIPKDFIPKGCDHWREAR